MVLRFISRRLRRLATRRPPDLVVGKGGDPYLLRWHLIPRNPLFNVYLHQFKRSDYDRALHDHPWWSLSLMLEGRYIEHRILQGGVHTCRVYKAGALILRGAKFAHRLEYVTPPGELDPWTLFITGPRLRTWGFHFKEGWRPWTEVVDRD